MSYDYVWDIIQNNINNDHNKISFKQILKQKKI